MTDWRKTRQQATFGGADGAVLGTGFVVGLGIAQPHAVFHAALAAGTAELIGMSAACWLSERDAGMLPALANGAAAFGSCLLPALPFLAAAGLVSFAAALVLVVAVALMIALLREEKGFAALAQTFGVLALAAVACWASSLI